MNINTVYCENCEYETKGALYLKIKVNAKSEPIKFKKVTRLLLNFWNEKVAEENNKCKIKKVIIK